MRYLILLTFTALASGATADENAFTTGPTFNDYGPIADVELSSPLSVDSLFMHSFDSSEPASGKKPNATLVSAARFINLHAKMGVRKDNIHVAVVVHGEAVKEMADDESSSAELIGALTDYGVRIIVCGQSAVYYDVATDDLLPGVEMALSAMTAHAVLQQQGYTLNPF